MFGGMIEATASDPQPVHDGSRSEADYSAVPGYRAWLQANDANNYRLIVKPTGADRYVVGKGDEVGAGSDLALGTALGDVLVFTGGNEADVRIWDLEAERFVRTPEGINTAEPEYGAGVSGDHLVFGRDPKRNGRSSQVVLADLTTGRSKILGRSKHGADPNSINGDWVTYTVCGTSTCDVFRYRISTGRARRIPHADRVSLYASTVTAHGTVFLIQGPHGCGGGGASIVRWTPDGRRTLWTSADRFDVWDMDALVHAGSTALFFQRAKCTRIPDDGFRVSYDIYRLEI